MKRDFYHVVAGLAAALILLVLCASTHAQDRDGDYVSRREYEELKEELLTLKKELDSLKHEKRTASTQKQEETHKAPAAEPPEDSEKAIAEPSAVPVLPTFGTTKFLITGDTEATLRRGIEASPLSQLRSILSSSGN